MDYLLPDVSGPRSKGLPLTWCNSGPRAKGLPLTWCNSDPRAKGLPLTWCNSGPRAKGLPLTWCNSGPRAKALSTHLPVITTSAPRSKALAIGPALQNICTTANYVSISLSLNAKHMSMHETSLC